MAHVALEKAAEYLGWVICITFRRTVGVLGPAFHMRGAADHFEWATVTCYIQVRIYIYLAMS
jgi:hypothetical protein